ncbi:MAG: hypothetical protein DMD55_03490 [Gemmatimonadetes bacterium]|nr:MAG: hypothetical protein DMD55_03490 [Gemmatimonadota bacterium]
MRASPSSSDGPGRAALSRDLADFLIELSIALHKHAMYPEGHPSLAPAAAGVTRRAALLLENRSTLSLGVARRQLVIEGIATDPKHPVLGELAERLHRHHLGAVTFRKGVEPAEVADVLKTLAVDAERAGQPLGLGNPERLRAWPHVQLHSLTYERLELVGEGAPAEGARAAQLWVGLARAALALQPEDDQPMATEPTVIAQAIDAHERGATAYDQVIVGYLLQIAEELKTAGSAEAMALRRRMSHLVRSLKPQTLRRLVEMGGDFVQRRKFVLDATAGMAVDAVLEILKAAADTSQQTISHSLVRLLSKLAAHADGGSPEIREEADIALREQVQELLRGWTLSDPNPGVYGTALERMARANPLFIAPAEGGYPAEPDRVVAMALEVDVVGPRTLPAVDRVVHEGRLPQLLDALAELPATSAAAAQVWERIATAEVIGRVVATEPVDFKVLDRLVPRVGSSAAAPLLDALAAAESRGTRRGLLAQLARMGGGIGPIVVARLEDPRWYVTRNMLGLLDELPALPEGFSPARYTLHADARVRWQAVKLQLKLPAERDAALVTALRDHEPRIMRLALGLLVALQACPEVLVPLLVSHATDRTLASDLRVLAIRALGGTSAPAALEALLRLTSAGRTLFGRARFPPKSPEVVVALQALATGWRGDPRAAARLTQAAASSDPEICAAARTARALR